MMAILSAASFHRADIATLGDHRYMWLGKEGDPKSYVLWSLPAPDG
jgi:hypothetical protein